MVAFVDPDPDHTGAVGFGSTTEQSQALFNRYKAGKTGQIYLLPYNSGYVNWIITKFVMVYCFE